LVLNKGIHNSPLDGPYLQTEAPKEPGSRQVEEVEICKDDNLPLWLVLICDLCAHPKHILWLFLYLQNAKTSSTLAAGRKKNPWQ
jgi:hypothetical protein